MLFFIPDVTMNCAKHFTDLTTAHLITVNAFPKHLKPKYLNKKNDGSAKIEKKMEMEIKTRCLKRAEPSHGLCELLPTWKTHGCKIVTSQRAEFQNNMS